MKTIICLSLAVIALAAIAMAGDTYTTKWDNVDLKEILNNKRLLKKYCDCLLNKGGCTPDAAELKSVLPDALKTNCAKCSEKQKEGSHVVIKHIYENEPEIFKELEAIYDKEGVYREQYKKDFSDLKSKN